MTIDLVTQAVRELRARGDKVSIRSVHSLTGGSFRDLSRLLKDAAEFLEDDELAGLETEGVEPSAPPSLGKIIETFQASQLADHEASAASAVMDETRMRLRDLIAHPPPPAVEPDDVPSSVEARLEHMAVVHQLQEEVNQLNNIVQSHQAEARALRVERNKLQQRSEELHNAILPSVRRTLAEAEHELKQRRIDLAHAVEMGERRVERTKHALSIYEMELRDLTGDR